MYSVLALLVSFYCAYSFILMKELSKFSMQIDCCSTWLYFFYSHGKNLRAASPKYQLDLEIAKKSNFFKLAQNEALRH